MDDAARLQLRRGPYRPPRTRRDAKLFCAVRGTVGVGGYTDAPIPWPRMKKGGAPCLILCGDLVKAVRVESVQAVAHHFGVSRSTVRAWRRALGVPFANEGTRRVMHDWAVGRDDDRLARARANSQTPDSIEKRAGPRRGKPPHPNLLAGSKKANTHTDAWWEKVRAKIRERGYVARPGERLWTPEEDALLGTDRDEVVAAAFGRAVRSVYDRRRRLGIPGHLVRVDVKVLRRLRIRAGLSCRQLSLRAGFPAGKCHAVEYGAQRSLPRDALARVAAVLGCWADELGTGPRPPDAAALGRPCLIPSSSARSSPRPCRPGRSPAGPR